MPSVPRLTQTVNEAALPNQRLDAAPAVRALETAGLSDQSVAAVGGVAKSIAEVAHQDQERIRKEQDKKLVTWSQGLDDQVLTEKQRLLYDPKDGVFKVGKGENAIPVGQAARVNYGKFLDKAIETAPNEEARELAKRIVSKRRADLESDLLHHEKAEDDALSKKKHEGLINTYRSEAVLSYRNPQRVKETIAMQDAAIDSYLHQNGIKGEDARRIVKEERSKTLSEIVKRYVVNDQDQLAKQFYDVNKDGFVGSDIDDVEKSLADGTKKGETFREFDRIMSKYKGWTNRREAAAQELKDRPEIRSLVDDKLVREQKIQEMQNEDQRDQIYADTVEALANANYDIMAIPQDWRRNLSPRQQISLKDKAKKGLAEIVREHKAEERDREQKVDRETRLSDREQRLADREQRLKEHEEDRGYTLEERKRREKERAEKKAEKAREEKESNDWEPNKQMEFKYETMPRKQLAQVSEAFLLQEVEPYISDQSWNKIKGEYGRAREEMGKPVKSLKIPGKKGAKDFHDPKLDSEVIDRLKAIPSTGIKDGDTINEIHNSPTKANTARIFMDNLKDEYKKHFDETGKYPSYDTRHKILDRLTTEATFKKKKFFGLIESDETKILGLAEKNEAGKAAAGRATDTGQAPAPKATKRPFDQITIQERDPYLRIGQKGKLFIDPSTKKVIPKEKIEARIVKAHEAKKRGASAREIIEILKKD